LAVRVDPKGFSRQLQSPPERLTIVQRYLLSASSVGRGRKASKQRSQRHEIQQFNFASFATTLRTLRLKRTF